MVAIVERLGYRPGAFLTDALIVDVLEPNMTLDAETDAPTIPTASNQVRTMSDDARPSPA